MKKLSTLFLAIILSLSLIGCGGDASSSTPSSSSSPDPVNELTPEKIVGLWSDSELELTYEFFLDSTFNTYISDIGGTTGEYELLEDSIKLIFTEDSIQIGRFDFHSDIFTVDDSTGSFLRVTGDNSDTNDNLGSFFGAWYSKEDGVSYTFNADGSFVKNSYDGSILAGIYDTGERDIYIYGDDDSVFTGYISEDKTRLEIGNHIGVFTKEFYDINTHTPKAEFDIEAIFGDWKYPDNSLYYTFNSDMTLVCHYGYNRSYNGQLYFDGSEITYIADNGNQGVITYFPERDEIRFNGVVESFVRGTVVFEEVEIDTTELNINYIGNWKEPSDIGDGYLVISDDRTFELYTAELGVISGSCYTHNYKLYLNNGDTQYTASYDTIEASLNVDNVGRFFKS